MADGTLSHYKARLVAIGSTQLERVDVDETFSSVVKPDLFAYLDADWASCPTIRRLTLGYCIFLGNNLISWSSKHQPVLSHSSVEAESRGVANVVPTTCWLRNLLRELHSHLSSATLVYCDNVNVVYLSCNPIQHQRTKHIEIDIHFVRDLVAAGQVLVLHVPSRYQLADIFTKGLSRGWVYNDALDAKEVCDGCTQGCPLKIFATLYDIEAEEWILDGIWELTSLTEGSNKGAIEGFEGTACSLSLKVDWTYARDH
uniref:Ribonuclease H-like domain-containing protein n=1 Tax=Tanacetum cinerariifolium TaxID=118510 RepID=A0A699GYR7_TANCI|nr:ribonuclease H-like domain-containing protein [Tanacetum cinerariifolium]